MIDLLTAPRRWPTTRLLIAVGGYALYALGAQVGVLLVWVGAGFGRHTWGPSSQRRLRALMGWWVNGIIEWFARTIGYRCEIQGEELVRPGPVLVLARHESIFDALLPPGLVTRHSGMAARVVFMRELLNEPSLDTVGNRTPHYFVARTAEDRERETASIGQLATRMSGDDAVVIFPEGRLFREDVRLRVIERLAETDPAAAERAAELRHLLPPRPGGVLALLDAASAETDVVFVAHVGFHELTDPLTVWRSVPLRRPIEVRLTRVASRDIPTGRADRTQWLHEQWRDMDQWVDSRRRERDRA